MTQIRQFRFYGDESKKNYPTNLTQNELSLGNIFRTLGSVTHLGIQAKPGTIFYLNGGSHPLTIGSTGIYELNLSGLTVLTSITFDAKSLKDFSDSNNGLIIDVVYNG